MIKPKILVAPLDWGLGHATRCIPIIREMMQRGCQVEIAGNGNSLRLLQQELPELITYEIPGYKISYPSNSFFFALQILAQVPRILTTVKKEHQWLIEKQKEKNWDLIISDNRYGCWHPGLRSVFITHQLQVLSGCGSFVDRILLKLHYRMIRRFTYCWVPDAEQQYGLAGILSHPPSLPINTQYIGPLSRLDPTTKNENQKIVVALSGPEPQRTLLEQKLINIFSRPEWKMEEFIFLRGLPDTSPDPAKVDNIRFIQHLNSKAFAEIISAAKIVICRSGYSSIMDLVRLRKKAVLIPTPGQTEQEYLAEWLRGKKLFSSCPQDDPKMSEIIQRTLTSNSAHLETDFDRFKKALDDLGIQ
jgi:uncharacterized protein (TIGR00661 family)